MYVWDDPNNDGDPSDGVLLTQDSATITDIDNDVLNRVALGTSVNVTGKFIIGASVVHAAGMFPGPRDLSQASLGRAWVTGVASGVFDPNVMAGNIGGPLEMDAINFPSVWMLSADAVPEPGTLALLSLGGLALLRRRR